MRLIGVEAAGRGIATGEHAASLSAGRPGVLHGSYSYLLQDEDGQVIETHSISAGLDYPGVGPEHSWLKQTERAVYESVTDIEALAAFRMPLRGRRASSRRSSRHTPLPTSRSSRRSCARTRLCWCACRAVATKTWRRCPARSSSSRTGPLGVRAGGGANRPGRGCGLAGRPGPRGGRRAAPR